MHERIFPHNLRREYTALTEADIKVEELENVEPVMVGVMAECVGVVRSGKGLNCSD
jgi:hypothetical protein